MVSVYTCVPVCTHAGGGDQASREAAYSRVRRPVLCTLPVRNLGSPHPQRRVILKQRLIVQYYLGGTVVALDISRLLTFLTAFHVIHPYQRESKKENVFYYSFLKRIICVSLHREDGLVFLASSPNSQASWLTESLGPSR